MNTPLNDALLRAMQDEGIIAARLQSLNVAHFAWRAWKERALLANTAQGKP